MVRSRPKDPNPSTSTLARTARVDIVSIAEASYRLDLDDQGWLQGIVDVARPVLDSGAGVVGAMLDSSRAVRKPAEVITAASAGEAERALECFQHIHLVPPSAKLRQSFAAAGPVGTLAETMGDTLESRGSYGDVLRSYGFADAMYVLAGDATGHSCVLSSPRRSRVKVLPRVVATWARAAAHIAAGHRLRMHLRNMPGDLDDGVEAVLDPGGKVHDAAGPAVTRGAREALRRAVLASEQARGPMRRRNPEQAITLWNALVSGRWSLVDRFDVDGRRFLVARRNEPIPPPRAPLSPRECQVAALVALGHSNTVIAYELGMAQSTVASRLASAMVKLGFRSRLELVQLLSNKR